MTKQLELPLGEILSPASPPLTRESFDNFSTFADNMKLPVHRWFRYSAGFSAQWVETVIAKAKELGEVTVIDPFVGSGTTLIAAEKMGVECYGIEAHPFIFRVAKAKLLYRTDPDEYLAQSLYLDYQKQRKARMKKKVSWQDRYGNSHDLDYFINTLEQSFSRQIQAVTVTVLHGYAQQITTIERAIEYIQNYAENQPTTAPALKYEVNIRYNNGDLINGIFQHQAEAIKFLETFA